MRLKLYNTITLVLLLAAGNSRGLTIGPKEVTFSGGGIFSREQLMETAGLRGKAGVTADELRAGCLRILERYRRAGYYQAAFSTEYGPDSLSALVAFIPGPVFTIGGVSFEGNGYLSGAYLQGIIATGRGQIPDSIAISHDMEAISLAYADNGFPQAEVAVKELSLEGSSLNLVFEIRENSRVLLSEIQFRGNLTTKDQTMLKLGGFRPEATFSRAGLEKSLQRLGNSGLFSEVGTPKLVKGRLPGRQQLLIEVKEARFNSIYGAAAYNQGSADQPGWLAGSLDLRLGNIAGTARSATVRWERLKKENSRLEVGYSEPFLLGTFFSAQAGLRHMVEDSSYVKSAASVLVRMPVGERFQAGVGAEYERIVPGASLVYQKNIKYSTKWLLEWKYDPRFPASGGIFMKMETDYGRKRYYQPSRHLTVSKVSGDLIARNRTFGRQEVYFSLKGRVVITGEKPVPRYDQFAMGGASSLRGYYEEQFVANQVAWSNLEYRFKPIRNFVYFPFADLGYFYDGERGLRGYRFAYGFGFKLDTKIGWINILYGLGQDDSILNGKVHFALENEF